MLNRTSSFFFSFPSLSLSGVFRCARPFLSFLSEMMIFCVSSLSFDLRIFFSCVREFAIFFLLIKHPIKKRRFFEKRKKEEFLVHFSKKKPQRRGERESVVDDDFDARLLLNR